MTSSARPRRLRRALLATAGAATVAAATLFGASPAFADACRYDGSDAMAYVTQPGHIYFAGCNGLEQYGVPTLVTHRGDVFSVGGNGIAPGTSIEFSAVNVATGASINWSPGVQDYFTKDAHSNSVVNEERQAPITAPPGTYRIIAFTHPKSNKNATYVQQVTNLQVDY